MQIISFNFSSRCVTNTAQRSKQKTRRLPPQFSPQPPPFLKGTVSQDLGPIWTGKIGSANFFIFAKIFAKNVCQHSQRLCSRVECGTFFWSDRTGQVTKGQAWFRSPIPKFRRPRLKVFFFKKFQGAQILIFFVKIGKELSFTLKDKRRNANLKFDFWKVPFWTPEEVNFWFLKKTPPKKIVFVFRLWFSFKKNRCTNVPLGGIFENAHKISYWPSKTPFWLFLAVNNGFFQGWEFAHSLIAHSLICSFCSNQMSNC